MGKRKRRTVYVPYDYEAAYQNSLEQMEEENEKRLLKEGKTKNIYATKEIRSGDQLEIEIYPEFARRQESQIPDEGRRKKQRQAQKNLNDKNSRKMCERLILENFDNRDIWATFTYTEEPETLEEAVRVGRHLEKLGYEWLEEPFRDFELNKYTQLCAALDIPIAATETTRGCHWGVAQVINQKAADIVRADVSWKCGVTGTLKIAHLAESFGMQCEIHTTTMNYMDLVNLHVSCAIRNCRYFEYFVPEEDFMFPMKGLLPIDEKGIITVPDKPGIGGELDWELIERNCVSHQMEVLE